MTAHNLGLLKAFPGELRAEIWRNLRPTTGSSGSNNTSTGGNALGVLRAGRQLSEEIIPYLYDEEILDIHVECVWSQWITVENAHGARWMITSICDELYERFSNLPYQMLKKLRISINAIEQGNPSLILSLIKNTRNLVQMLEHQGGLPSLEIHFLDSSLGKWTRPDGEPLKTDQTLDYDYMNVLLPFCRLRSVPEVRIHVPENMTSQGYLFENAENAMQDTIRFGTAVGDSFWSDDSTIQWSLDNSFINVETRLDFAIGTNADMMRLEVLMCWYNENGRSDYVKEWERIRLEPDGPISMFPQSTDNLEARYRWMLTLNPLSAPMQKMRLQLGLPSTSRLTDFPLAKRFSKSECDSYFEKVKQLRMSNKSLAQAEDNELFQDEAAVARLRTCWSQIAWKEYYPQGVPPMHRRGCNAVHSDLIESVMCPPDTKNSREPKPCLRYIKKSSKHIDFQAGEATRKALERFVNGNQQDSSETNHLKGLGSKVCKVWDEFQL
ncbi:hypothetical protein ONS95_001961 [Cadophora gregata]|uniref:uncharacterized protein n=1 Tax=Cadophora gregata TaxID=51156 RepID=UPI0026DAFFC2|nr:uncharacterized protein ONS95_001961 [Cadophora gregata]KAK0111615.1 hypothetical protein ONS95_001961 [Cadophora gregata]KAK0111909.1 hypothetical protein ONS96_001176 [Cadophora gregata f. sp. sojae]